MPARAIGNLITARRRVIVAIINSDSVIMNFETKPSKIVFFNFALPYTLFTSILLYPLASLRLNHAVSRSRIASYLNFRDVNNRQSEHQALRPLFQTVNVQLPFHHLQN